MLIQPAHARLGKEKDHRMKKNSNGSDRGHVAPLVQPKVRDKSWDFSVEKSMG